MPSHLKHICFICTFLLFACTKAKDLNYLDTKVAYVNKDNFTSINAAIESFDANTTDTITIYIAAGTYEEYLKLHNRSIRLIGENKENTFIIGRKGDYYQPAAELSGNIYVEHITFKELANAISEPAPTLPSYAVHLDYYGKGIMHFNNCNFESNSHAALGIGLHDQQTLILEQCSIICTNPLSYAMYLHNNPFPDNNNNQKFIAQNCTFISNNYNGYIIKLDDAAWTWENNNNVDTTTVFTFINNQFVSSVQQTPTVYLMPEPFQPKNLVGNIFLDTASKNNSILLLNASQ